MTLLPHVGFILYFSKPETAPQQHSEFTVVVVVELNLIVRFSHVKLC